jgi:hypothetical protein
MVLTQLSYSLSGLNKLKLIVSFLSFMLWMGMKITALFSDETQAIISQSALVGKRFSLPIPVINCRVFLFLPR